MAERILSDPTGVVEAVIGFLDLLNFKGSFDPGLIVSSRYGLLEIEFRFVESLPSPSSLFKS